MTPIGQGLPVVLGAPWGLILLVLVPVAAWLERRAGGSRADAALRAAIVMCLAVAAALPAMDPGAGLRNVVLVDRSGSVAADEAEAALADVGAAAGRAAVAGFGDLSTTPLAAAIERGAAFLPDGGHVVIISDGLSTDDGAVEAARWARRMGVRVDAAILPTSDDVAITQVTLPDGIRVGSPVVAGVTIRSSRATHGTLDAIPGPPAGLPSLAQGGGDSGEGVASGKGRWHAQIDIPAGVSEHRLDLGVASGWAQGGYATMAVDVTAEGDGDPRNNSGYGIAPVYPPPRALVIGDGLGAVTLADAWTGAGMAVTVAAPDRTPPGALGKWDAIAVADMSAAQLGDGLMSALAAFVSQGGGLLLSGGRQSFTAGAWEGTPLADLAPVRLEPPDRGARDPVALLLIVDTSASMGAAEGAPVLSKLDLAREAAALAVDALGPEDLAGIVTYSDTARWSVPMDLAGADPASFGAALADLTAGGGTRILPALQLGLPVLAASGARVRHAVLLTDGQDTVPDPEALFDAARQGRGAGVTLSTIAIGQDADVDLLARLASIGRGRSHAALNPGDLPRLTLEESRIARGRTEQIGRFPVELARPHPIVAGVTVAGLPPIDGYLAMRPREGAETVLQTPGGDPLLTTWRLGAGRVAAWTSDTGEAWSADWVGDDQADMFWAALGRYLARDPGADLHVTSRTDADGVATVRVDARSADGLPMSADAVTAVITRTGGIVPAETIAMAQVAPGAYSGQTRVSPGAYPLEVRWAAGGRRLVARGGLAWLGAPEWRAKRGGPGLLAAVAQAGGGRSGTAAEVALDPVGERRLVLWPPFLAAAALLWLFAVARQMGVRLPRPRRARKKRAGLQGRAS